MEWFEGAEGRGVDVTEFKKDYDWQAAFQEAINGGYDYGENSVGPVDSVVRVCASSVGENDGASWICVAEMSDGRFCVIDAGCDYTGWDCQASGTAEYHETEGTAFASLTPDQCCRFGVTHPAV